MVATKKTKLFVHTQLCMTIQWQSKVVDPVSTPLLSFLYSFYL
jgi:hypothetical protein